MTDGNVSAADKEGDDNVNETDCMLKRDSDSSVAENESIGMR